MAHFGNQTKPFIYILKIVYDATWFTHFFIRNLSEGWGYRVKHDKSHGKHTDYGLLIIFHFPWSGGGSEDEVIHSLAWLALQQQPAEKGET